jgi:hypothetical protein
MLPESLQWIKDIPATLQAICGLLVVAAFLCGAKMFQWIFGLGRNLGDE